MILISDKIDFKTKAKRQRKNGIMIKRINPTRRYNPGKHLYIQHRTT